MKACVLHAVGELRCEDVAVPALQPGEALVKIRASGICGSDVQRVFEKGTYRFPTIPGHEFAGEVLAVQDDANADLVGRRVAVFPLLPCFSCAACELGEYAQCARYDYYGSRRDGGFAEALAVKIWNLVPVPDDVSFEEAALCEPTAVAVHAMERAELRFGESIAIFGAGTIGLLLAKIAQNSGAGRVMLVDVDERKLSFARALGFSHCLDGRDAVSGILRITDGQGAQVVIEGTGASPALTNCLSCAAPFGRVVLMGNPAGDMNLPQAAYWTALRRQLTLRGTWNSRYNAVHNDWRTALTMMPRLDVGRLVTHRFDLADCGRAFALVRDQSELAVKALFVNEA